MLTVLYVARQRVVLNAIFTSAMRLNELKKMIREQVQNALGEPDAAQVTMGKAYRWKELVMKAVQDSLYARGDLIESQEQLESAVDEEIQKIREDLDLTMSMIGRALYQVPFQAFKAPKPPSE